jgi:hypothetical protein
VDKAAAFRRTVVTNPYSSLRPNGTSWRLDLLTQESESDLPPEPGFARREAQRHKERWTEQTSRRLRPLLNNHPAVKEGVHGGTRGSPVKSEGPP